MTTIIIMLLTLASMVAVGLLAWKAVGKQEHGDDDLEAQLRADDERAEAGRRRRAGLPPLRPPSLPDAAKSNSATQE